MLENQTVAEVMQPCPAPIRMTASIDEAAKRMSEQHESWLPVDGVTGPVGVLSAGDIVRRTAMEGSELGKASVSDVMTVGVVCCRSTDSVLEALRLIDRHRIHQVGVVDQDDRLSAVANACDLISLVVAEKSTTT